MCLERIRKTYGKSVKHWCITELGEDKDRIHIHGIVWGIGSDQKFKEKWKYGIVWVGKYVSSRTHHLKRRSRSSIIHFGTYCYFQF